MYIKGYFRFILSCKILILLVYLGCGRKENLGGEVTIINYSRELSSNYSNWMNVIDEFEKSHPNIQVKNINVPGLPYWDKLLTMIAGNNPPDMILEESTRFPNMVINNKLLDLTPYLEKDQDIKTSDFFESAIKRVVYKGKVYGFPSSTGVILPFYNKDLFDISKIPYPTDSWTWEEFLLTSRKLTKDINGDGLIDQYGCSLPPWMVLVWANGGDIVDNVNNPTRCTLDSPESIEAIQWVSDLIHKYKVAPSPTKLVDQAEDIFLTGKVAISFQGHWLVPQYRSAPFKWDVVALPEGKKGRAGFNFGSCYSILSSSKYPNESYELVKFFAGEKGSSILATSGYFTPALKEVANSDIFLNSGPPANQKAFLEGMSYGHEFPFTVHYAEMMTQIEQELQLVWGGHKEPHIACREIVRRVNAILNQ